MCSTGTFKTSALYSAHMSLLMTFLHGDIANTYNKVTFITQTNIPYANATSNPATYRKQ